MEVDERDLHHEVPLRGAVEERVCDGSCVWDGPFREQAHRACDLGEAGREAWEVGDGVLYDRLGCVLPGSVLHYPSFCFQESENLMHDHGRGDHAFRFREVAWEGEINKWANVCNPFMQNVNL